MVSKPSVLTNFLQALLAIILGNVVYFALIPSLASGGPASSSSPGPRHGARFLVLPGSLRLDPNRQKVAIVQSKGPSRSRPPP